MSQQAVTSHSPRTAAVPHWTDRPRAEDAKGLASGELPFTNATRETRIQFTPHRLVRSYADYRRLGAGSAGLFG